MEEVRLCKDCKWGHPPLSTNAVYNYELKGFSYPFIWEEAICRNPNAQSLVDGKYREKCEMLRVGACGPEGHWWEERVDEKYEWVQWRQVGI